MTHRSPDPVPLLLPVEVGRLFGVGPKSTLRWVGEKRISALRTPGGHHRFHPDEVRRVLINQYDGEEQNQRLRDLDDLIAGKR